MKKKFVVMMGISGVLMAGIVTGCSNKEASTPTTSVTVETTIAAGNETVAASSGDYLSWSGKEWNAASDEDKSKASELYLIESIKLAMEVAGQPFTDQMASTITADVIAGNVTALDAAFAANADMKLQDLLDMASGVVGAAAETVKQ